MYCDYTLAREGQCVTALYGREGDKRFGTGVTRTIPRARISASRTEDIYSFHSVVVSGVL